MKNILNALLFQLAWWLIAILAAQKKDIMALAVGLIYLTIHFTVIVNHKRSELSIVFLGATWGYCFDLLFAKWGLFILNSKAPHLWLFSIWLVFSATWNFSLRPLIQNKYLGPILFGVFGPISYYLADKLNILSFNQSTPLKLAIYVIYWSMFALLIKKLINFQERKMIYGKNN